jgi:acyl-CoA reductase-like NAD-dependent aldehyde dehydrogenase
MSTTMENPVRDLMQRGMIIGDERLSQGSAGTMPHRNPATGRVQVEVPLAGQAEVDQAVQAARQAFGTWRALAPDERGRLLSRLADIVVEHADELSQILSLEAGRPVQETAFDPNILAAWTRYFAGWTDKIEGQLVPVPTGSSGLDYVVAEPYGVVGGITPFNIALLSMGMKVVPALAAGNTIVVKTSELTPFSGLRFGELALEAGLPPGVLNVVSGAAEAGDTLIRHPGVDKISFTGGIETAKRVMAAAAENVKPLTLELGGKSANIMFPDADLDVAVPFALFMGAVFFAGQGCVLPTRLFVHNDIYDEVAGRLVQTMAAFPIGDPLDPATAVGPVISESACDRILGVIEQAKSEGAGKLLLGGERIGGDLAGGYFIHPTLFGDVDNASSLAQNEVFGPVLSMIRFETEEEVVTKANDTKYGLGAYLFTRDVGRVHRIARDLEAGYVSVNGFSLGPASPFGGMKQSGFGSEGGRWGLYEFLRPKNVFVAY